MTYPTILPNKQKNPALAPYYGRYYTLTGAWAQVVWGQGAGISSYFCAYCLGWPSKTNTPQSQGLANIQKSYHKSLFAWLNPNCCHLEQISQSLSGHGLAKLDMRFGWAAYPGELKYCNFSHRLVPLSRK
jgi:hypothetical protein